MSREQIENGSAILGIEFGSTRIKSVLIDREHRVIASGSHEWENDFQNGVWTYSEEAIFSGLQGSYADLKKNVFEQYGITLRKLGGMGVSAMMHGYLPFDKDGNRLDSVPHPGTEFDVVFDREADLPELTFLSRDGDKDGGIAPMN